MSKYSNQLQPDLQNLLQHVVRFFHPRSSCPMHISVDVCGGRKSLDKPVMRKNISSLGMLIPGYLDTRVPCDLPGSRPGSRKTSKLPSYRDRLHQSNDCPCGHIQTELLFISVYVYISIKYVIYSSNKSV